MVERQQAFLRKTLYHAHPQVSFDGVKIYDEKNRKLVHHHEVCVRVRACVRVQACMYNFVWDRTFFTRMLLNICLIVTEHY